MFLSVDVEFLCDFETREVGLGAQFNDFFEVTGSGLFDADGDYIGDSTSFRVQELSLDFSLVPLLVDELVPTVIFVILDVHVLSSQQPFTIHHEFRDKLIVQHSIHPLIIDFNLHLLSIQI